MAKYVQERIGELEHHTRILAWLHAELIHQLTVVTAHHHRQIDTLAWLHAELVHQIMVFASQQPLLQQAGIATVSPDSKIKQRDPRIQQRAATIARLKAQKAQANNGLS